jgi:uncharacterized protein
MMANEQVFGLFPNSFHVFEFRGEYILFDRGSGLVCEINEFTFDLFHLVEQGKNQDEILTFLETKHGECDVEVCIEVITTMKDRGFFKPVTQWASVENFSFESYWRHHPRRIQLMTAQCCNLKCGYCYAWRNDANDPGTYMSWETAKQGVDFLVHRSGGRRELQVTFFGGEPLLNFPVIKKIVEYCKEIEQNGKHHFCFELITNGTLLTSEITDYIADHQFLLFISLDGWQEMHNYNRPSLDGRDLHETILQNALYANSVYEKRKLPKIKIRANLTNRFSDLRKVAAYLESFGFTYIGIGAIEPLPHSDPSGMSFSEEQMDVMSDTMTEMMMEAIDSLKNNRPIGCYIQRAINKTAISVESRLLPGVICGVCRNTAIVDNQGNLFPCHRYAGMTAFQIGNIFSGIDKDQVITYYKKIASRAIADCQDCWIRDFCAGGCPWSLSDKNGNIHSLSAKTCNRLRKNVERGLWLKKELYTIRPNMFSKTYQNMIQKWEWNNAPNEFC